jgi:pyridoxal phosphate enzyme (YggS family)
MTLILFCKMPLKPTPIVAVSKTRPGEEILPFLQDGHRWFGENRVQEAMAKWPPLREEYPDIRLHLVGSLQTNKAKQAVELFNVIETVDRPELIMALKKAWDNPARLTDKLLIQVNTGREPQKGGVLVENLADLVALCHDQSLPLTGLMVIPPVNEDPVPHFRMLTGLARTHGLSDLSMGMSQDYQAALNHGATWVRLGRAFFSNKILAVSP